MPGPQRDLARGNVRGHELALAAADGVVGMVHDDGTRANPAVQVTAKRPTSIALAREVARRRKAAFVGSANIRGGL